MRSDRMRCMGNRYSATKGASWQERITKLRYISASADDMQEEVVDILPNSDNKWVRFKDGSVGVFGYDFHKYNSHQHEIMRQHTHDDSIISC